MLSRMFVQGLAAGARRTTLPFRGQNTVVYHLGSRATNDETLGTPPSLGPSVRGPVEREDGRADELRGRRETIDEQEETT